MILFRFISPPVARAIRLTTRIVLWLGIPGALCPSASAQHSDVLLRLHTQNNQIETASVVPGASGRVFASAMDQSPAPGTVFGQPGFLQAMFGDDPGYASANVTPGYSPLPGGRPVYVDFVPFQLPGKSPGNVAFWPGEGPLDFESFPTGQTLTIEGSRGVAGSLDGSASRLNNVFVINTSSTGAIHTHLEFYVDDGPLLSTPRTAPRQGAYLIAAQARMDNVTPSRPYLIFLGSLAVDAAELAALSAWGEANLAAVQFEPFVNAAPRVTGIAVRGGQWSDSFATDGWYEIPLGPDQSGFLPWTGIDQIRLRFSEDVAIAGDDLILSGIATNSFRYDPLSATAFFGLEESLALHTSGNISLGLSGDVRDRAGAILDGEWFDNVSTISGDGVAGGEFRFAMNIAPGDADRSGDLSPADIERIRGGQFSGLGDPRYSIFADINGTGSIFSDDLLLARNRLATAPLHRGLAAASSAADGVPEPATGLLVAGAGGWLAFRRPSRRATGPTR